MKYDIGSDIPLITDNVVSRARDERLPGVIFEDILIEAQILNNIAVKLI